MKKEAKTLTVLRLKLIPDDVRISIGDEGVYSPEELIIHVNKEDKIGKKVIKIESEYLKFLEQQ